jgi:ABC-2 type transport system ATP-binding protein
MTDTAPADSTAQVAPIVSARGLTKRYGKREILHGLDFDIPPGRIYGLVGHNGAGKTTTLNTMLGLTSYEGSIRVPGLDPFAQRAKLMEDVAFISDVASLPRFLRVRELFALVANIHPRFSQDKARDLLEGTDIRPDQRIKTLSKGMLAQLHLAVVMAIDARLLVLDEPTLGLDISYRKRFYRRLLEDYMTQDRTLIITTHQVDEIEFMLSDIMFIRDGDLIVHMQMETVSTRYSQLVLTDPARLAEAAALGPVFTETRFGQTVMVFDGVDRAVLAGLGQVSTPTLSDLFVALMQRPTGSGKTGK